MQGSRTARLFARFDAAEYRLCLRLNKGCDIRALRGMFATVSRLGDGILWYVLMLMLPVLYGEAGVGPAVQMALTGGFGVLLYKALKQRLVRERPYISLVGVRAGLAPLDRYSFPSGHTLHAVCFATIVTHYFPELGWLVWPFAALVAASRPVLGLHYPSDVVVGAGLGVGLAAVSLALY